MSGVVNAGKKAVGAVSDTVRDIGRDLTDQPLKGLGKVITAGASLPLGAIGQVGAVNTTGAVQQGAAPIQAVGAGAKSMVAPFIPDQALPNIAIQDPKEVAAENERQRSAAARQAQIDQMTGAPGRGGTILTDKYTYRT